jgi:hypothetical protein
VERAADITDADVERQLGDGTRGQIPSVAHQGRPTHYTMQHAVDSSGTLAAPEGGGTGHHIMLLYPVPDDEYTIDLRVARKPLARMVADGDEPEIDEDYHLLLCDYACWRALTNNRPEGAQMADPRPFLESWERGLRDAKRNIALLRAGVTQRAVANWTGKRSGR